MSTEYHFSEFNVLTDSLIPGRSLLFNTMTGALLELDSSVVGSEVTIDSLGVEQERLVADGFVVPTTMDERAIVRSWHRPPDWQPGERGSLSLTIAPTVGCNFRCTYCFQEHPDRTMSESDFNGVLAYVRRRLEPGQFLSISWFGGEPLSAFEPLRELSERLGSHCKEIGSELRQSMITNGSLLTGRRLKWVRNAKLDMLQITLDGTEAVHNARRKSRGGDGTFERVIRGIKNVRDLPGVVVRVNIDERNIGDFLDLLDLFLDEGLEGVPLDIGHVKPYTSEAAKDLSNGEMVSRKRIAELRLQMIFAMLEKGFKNPFPALPKPQRLSSLCGADNGRSMLFSPGGLVFKCWNEAALPEEQAAFRVVDGHLEEQANGVAERWRNYDPFSHEGCNTCLVQPMCRGGCPWVAREKKGKRGDCTPLRWNVAEIVKLAHLGRTIHGVND